MARIALQCHSRLSPPLLLLPQGLLYPTGLEVAMQPAPSALREPGRPPVLRGTRPADQRHDLMQELPAVGSLRNI